MIRRPPRSTRTDTLFPYTTLFRSHRRLVETEIRRKLPQDRSKLAPEEQQPRGEEIGKRRFDFPKPIQVGDVAAALDRENEVVRRLGAPAPTARPEERRLGNECVSTCRSRWSPTHKKKTILTHVCINA